jgi:cytochrome bd-type quinol oxidase subunit 2
MSVMHSQSEFIQNRVKDKKNHEAGAFNFTYMFVFINNPRFAEFLPLIYPPELEIKDTTDTASSASFLTIVINSVLKFMINGMTSILKS